MKKDSAIIWPDGIDHDFNELVRMTFHQDEYFYGDVLMLIRVFNFIEKLSTDLDERERYFPGEFCVFSWNEIVNASPERLGDIMLMTWVKGRNIGEHLRKVVLIPDHPDFFPARIAILEDDWLYRILHTYIGINDKHLWHKRVGEELEKKLDEPVEF